MLTVKRWRSVHDLGMELLEVTDPAAQVLQGLSSLLCLVPGDVAGEVEVAPGRTPRITEIPELLRPMLHADVQAIFRTNPAVVYLAEHHHLSAARVEDLCGPAQWARNLMRRQLLEPNRVPFALLAGDLTSAGVVHGWGVNRSRPFDDDDVEVLRAFAGFLRRAGADRRRQNLVIDLEHAVSSGAGLVLFRGDEVIHLNGEAAALLERHQVALTTVLRVSRTALGPSQPVGALPTRRGAVRLRWRPALPGSSAVVIDEVGGGRTTLRSTLTTRQYAILCHLSHGLTAAAIGRQVGISERTVHKHLENVYRALSVSDRLAAVSRGRELGLLPVVGGCGRLDGTAAVGG
ncbi:hypothetical protein GTR02_00170 [Kineococcus sp. R8]|uniref:helix-turn-helix transcriptional regulator n=1 Tax=Kineococcus siccus TaxID=2696567 RepID=UPI0014122147|nr:LuxR C-terminal-related transcriptional regulator [Kineococcus siccus]NAZ80236.1 hypothetical protein [Kineococcus siccus]